MRDVRTIQRELESVDQRRAELERELADAESMPSEPEPGSMIKFHAQFFNSDPVSRYGAFNFGPNAWLLVSPGGHTAHHTWESLVAVMRKDLAVASGVKKMSYQVVKKWETLTW